MVTVHSSWVIHLLLCFIPKKKSRLGDSHSRAFILFLIQTAPREAGVGFTRRSWVSQALVPYVPVAARIADVCKCNLCLERWL